MTDALSRATCIALLLVLAGCASRLPPPAVPDIQQPSAPPPPQIDLPVSHTDFQPANCEFHARIAGTPEVREQFRGELLLTSASIRYDNGISLRVSCTPFIVLDRAAFEAQLESQIRFAARRAGVHDAAVFIREQARQTIASYWGIRGNRESGQFLRSDTYIGNRSFLEVLVMTPQRLQQQATSTRMIRIRQP